MYCMYMCTYIERLKLMSDLVSLLKIGPTIDNNLTYMYFDDDMIQYLTIMGYTTDMYLKY